MQQFWNSRSNCSKRNTIDTISIKIEYVGFRARPNTVMSMFSKPQSNIDCVWSQHDTVNYWFSETIQTTTKTAQYESINLLHWNFNYTKHIHSGSRHRIEAYQV